MTISGTSTSITVDGDGLTSVFNYDFYMGGSASYAALVYIDADGGETTVPAADFSITGVTSQAGGTFTYLLSGSPIASGTSLRLSRVLPLVQNAAIGNQGNFYPSTVEGALDYLTMVAQQQSLAGTLTPSSLFGNSTTGSAAGAAIPIGAGLSFSGNTLVISGINGSGTVTEVNSGEGITGGPVTGVGTLSLSSVTTGFVLANFSGGPAAPRGVQLEAGSGITFSGTTTSLTIASSGMAFITSSTGAGSPTVTFSSITSAFRHLTIVFSGRSTAGSTPGVNVQMTFNGDGGGNYDLVMQQLQNTTNASNNLDADTFIRAGFVPWSASTTSNVGNGTMTIHDYKATTLFKSVTLQQGSIGATAIGNTFICAYGMGLWRSTAAITQIDLTLAAGNWETGSSFSLYGLT